MPLLAAYVAFCSACCCGLLQLLDPFAATEALDGVASLPDSLVDGQDGGALFHQFLTFEGKGV